MSAKDIEVVKKMVEPFAELAGWAFKGRVMGLITEVNMRQAYKRLGGATAVREKFKAAADAIVRIGGAGEGPSKTEGVR